ncbi:MAG: low molecular weight phosphotyrosine protein phosphatase [Betaproteobacteria bacterium]|nr:low molecular weight phosphotyrosine protein phosphatase [Betaproteobacteria bacterium]
MTKIKILFVCMGNICRSPTAEGVFRQQIADAGMSDRVEIDSAGTHDYHVGSPPDNRTRLAALQRGYDLSNLRGRQVELKDFQEFDYILVMDGANLAELDRICPAQHRHKVNLFMEFSCGEKREVPDPYYGGSKGFENVLNMLEDGASGLLTRISVEPNKTE